LGDRKGNWTVKISVPIIPKGSVVEDVKEENQRTGQPRFS